MAAAVAAATLIVAASPADASIALAPPSDVPLSGEPAVNLVDMDLDGRLDLVAASGGEQYVDIRLGNGDGTFGTLDRYFTDGIFGRDLTVGSFNGDGNPDLALVSHGANDPNFTHLGENVSIFLGTGGGGLGAVTTIQLVAPSHGDLDPDPTPPVFGHSIASGDFTGDGNTDLAVSTGAGQVMLLTGNGSGGFSSPSVVATFPTNLLALTAGDFNLDGTPDLAAASQAGDNVLVLLGDGAGGFSAAATPAAQDGPAGIVTADVNTDGNPDLVVANQNSGNVTVLVGDGSGTGWAGASYAAGARSFAPAVADLDGDGKLDIAVANHGHDLATSSVAVLRGNGAGGFASADSFAANRHPNSIAAGDLNGDGKPDLVVGNRSDSQASVLINTSTPPSGDTTPPTIDVSATSNGNPYVSGTWTRFDVVVHFTCDDESGVQSVTPDVTLTSEGAGQSVAGSCTDTAGNAAEATFSDIRIDKSAPVLTVSPLVVDATDSIGAEVASYPVSATDNFTAAVGITCGPPPPATFPIGTSLVACVAVDDAGNSDTEVLTVTVLGATEQLGMLQGAVTGIGRGGNLAATVQAANYALAAGNTEAACNTLQALIYQAQAQSGRQLSPAQTAAVISDTTQIRAVLGC